jgi:GGDEF domain-containing protein
MAGLLAPCPIMRLAADESIAESQIAHLYIVLRGALSVANDTRTGMADGTISKILPGESVGEQSVLDEEANLNAITALEETEVLVIEAELVWQLIDESNVLARNLLRLLSFRIRAANAQLRRRQKLGEFYRQLSMIDGLTDLYNRAWLNDLLPTMVATAHGSHAPLSLIMIDLDHFKRFNDTHGHLAGDKPAHGGRCAEQRAAPDRFRGALRRRGNDGAAARHQREGRRGRGRAPVRTHAVAKVFGDMRLPLPHITASFGVASLQPQQDEQSLIAHADAALYRAKALGRNCVAQHQAAQEAHEAPAAPV